MYNFELGVAARSRPAGIAPSVRRSPFAVFIVVLSALVSAGQTSDGTSADPSVNPQASTPAEATGSRAVLYEEDLSDPNGQQYAGSVRWRTDRIQAVGLPDENAVHADIEIPARQLTVVLSIRRNTDKSLPASHVIELTFVAPPDFAGGEVTNVPGMLTKSAERARGVPLAGASARIDKGFFRIGLSNIDADRARNLQYLKFQSWIDIPMVYANQHRAILAIEKGSSGERTINEALVAWDQPR
jgi:hypothetical protein